MFEVGIVTQFEAAHQLHGNFGPATRVHGHTYRVEVIARGPTLRTDGTLCDMGLLQNLTREVVDTLHYQNLNDLPEFVGKNTTAEIVSRYIFEQIVPGLSLARDTTITVRVFESPSAWAGYEGSTSEISKDA